MPPIFYFLCEGCLAFFIFLQQRKSKHVSLMSAPSFSFRLKHAFIFLLFALLFLMFFATKPGFYFFFMIPLGYFMNKNRFIALCIWFYLAICASKERQQEGGNFIQIIFHPIHEKLLGIWCIGLLCVLSTLYGPYFHSCPLQTAMAGYKEVFTSGFCEGSPLAQYVCRHDRGKISDAVYDGKSGNFYFTHIRIPRDSISPLCMFSPHAKHLHKTLWYQGSAHLLIFSRSKNAIYLPLTSEPKVLVVDATSFKVKKTYRLASSPLMDAVLDHKQNILYVLSETSTVYKIYLSSGKIQRRSFKQYAGINGYAMALNVSTQTLYITSWISGTLTKIDARKLKLLKVKRFLPFIMGVAVNEKKEEIYVARPFPSSILVLDAATLKKKKTIFTEFGTRSVVYIKEKELLAAGNYFTGTVQFFDAKTHVEVFRFYVGHLLRGLTYDAISQNVFSFSACGIYQIPLSQIYPQIK